VYSKRFNEIFDNLLEIEKRYSNNKYDSGGETMFGITKRVARNYGYYGNMKKLSVEKAKEIYFKTYWQQPVICEIKSREIVEELFEQGVNMGPGVAVKNLQKALNLLLEQEIKVDGKIGPNTLEALNRCVYKEDLLRLLNGYQIKRYIEICEANPRQKLFIRGWLKRVEIRRKI